MAGPVINICLSGGAEGADLQFGMTAGETGHQVVHFIFDGHHSRAPKNELVVLTADHLKVADEYLVLANKTLKRKWPTRNNFANNLLRRNYYQVAWAGSVYAVSTIEDEMVAGGTAWAVQMYLDRTDIDHRAYVYDQNLEHWFQWTDGYWGPIEGDPPRPEGIWAGIGTRKLNISGKEAIRKLTGWIKPELKS